jgi:hypothetical protein
MFELHYSLFPADAAPKYNRESDRQFANGHVPAAKGIYRVPGGQRAPGEGSGLSRAGDKRRHLIRHAVGERHANCSAFRAVRPNWAPAEEQLAAMPGRRQGQEDSG